MISIRVAQLGSNSLFYVTENNLILKNLNIKGCDVFTIF
jgi:hypothetical protein